MANLDDQVPIFESSGITAPYTLFKRKWQGSIYFHIKRQRHTFITDFHVFFFPLSGKLELTQHMEFGTMS